LKHQEINKDIRVFLYGMGMEEKDEKLKKTYVVEDIVSDHATWMVEGSKMNGSATTIGFPRPTR